MRLVHQVHVEDEYQVVEVVRVFDVLVYLINQVGHSVVYI
jgi:hypothetical protein